MAELCFHLFELKGFMEKNRFNFTTLNWHFLLGQSIYFFLGYSFYSCFENGNLVFGGKKKWANCIRLDLKRGFFWVYNILKSSTIQCGVPLYQQSGESPEPLN